MQIRSELDSFLEARAILGKQKKSSSISKLLVRESHDPSTASLLSEKELADNVRRPFLNLMHLIPASDKKSTFFDKLHNIKSVHN